MPDDAKSALKKQRALACPGMMGAVTICTFPVPQAAGLTIGSGRCAAGAGQQRRLSGVHGIHGDSLPAKD